jgi:predicted RNA-binding Zn-ribbon protein involved in translation (DUF1610 family)
MSRELPLFVGGQLNVERGDATVTCPGCGAVLFDCVQIERFVGTVFVCPGCKTHCDPSPAAEIGGCG